MREAIREQKAARKAPRQPRPSGSAEGGTPTAGVGVAVEPGRRVAVGPGGGCGVAGRKEPALGVALAGTFASSCAAQVLESTLHC